MSSMLWAKGPINKSLSLSQRPNSYLWALSAAKLQLSACRHGLPRRLEASYALSAVAAPPDARLTASRSGILLDLMLGDMSAGGLEDNPLTYRHRVVGEPFVVAAQQSDVDRGRDGVRPLAVHQDAEQQSM